jgi:hypothetical protein
MTDTLLRTRTKAKLSEMPRIFADGKNDDSPGFAAAIKNEAVEYDGTVYKPGEDIEVSKRHVRLGSRLIVRGPDAAPIDPIEEMKRGPYVLILVPRPWGRLIGILHCLIECIKTPEWPHDFECAFDFDDVDLEWDGKS